MALCQCPLRELRVDSGPSTPTNYENGDLLEPERGADDPRLELRGGCQCGAVQYVAQVEDDEAYYCHCRMCQKAFGNLFGTFFFAVGESVRWESGEPAYFHSSNIARRGFCRECGTPLSFEYLGSEEIT